MAKKINKVSVDDIFQMVKEKRMTLGSLSKLTGISKPHLSLMFNGHRNMTITKMNLILDAINEYDENMHK